MAFHVPEQYRILHGVMRSSISDGNNGAFQILPSEAKRRPLFFCMASDGSGWEHVSVSTSVRCPTWAEMCWIKSLFWDEEDCVIQYHPPASQYVNNHPFCLHLWRPTDCDIPQPPTELVGLLVEEKN
jgi:hypothetical protein